MSATMKFFRSSLFLASAVLFIGCPDDRPDAGPIAKDQGVAADAEADLGVSTPADGGDASTSLPDGGDAAGFPDAEADGGEPAEAGLPDADGYPDAFVCEGRDASVGLDRGPTTMHGPCVNNTEGCTCTSTVTMQPLPFAQESCEGGLVCVHWDNISGLAVGMELEGEVKTCVRPCVDHADCGPDRYCAAAFPFDAAAVGFEKVCVDRLAGYDEVCSGSRLATEQIVDPAVASLADDIVACEEGLTCQLFTFGNAFNPDEGVCANLCQSDADCCGREDLPYCNPRFFATTDPMNPFLGMCSDNRHPNGAICGSTDPNKIFRISTGCDTSEYTCGPDGLSCPVCVGINLDQNNSLTPTGTGICMSPCDATAPCWDNRTCIPNFFQSGQGVCSDTCTSLPETCPGTGSLGNGQDCLELQGGASFCTDRYTPALVASTWANGMITAPGGDCTGDLENYSFFRCPDHATCLPTMDQGFCVFGCRFMDPMLGDTLCQTILNAPTATCVEPQAGFGVCQN
jgi:hypothetical protein